MAFSTESSHFAHYTETTTSMFILVLSSRIGIISTATLKLDFQLFQITVNFIFRIVTKEMGN